MLSTFKKLVNLTVYFENYYYNNWNECVVIIDELDILSSPRYPLETAIEKYKYLSEYIQLIIDKILDTFMQVLYHQYEIEKSSSNITLNVNNIRQRASQITTFMSLCGIYPSTEINAKISQLRVMMEC